jgi:hypothetical protein
MKNVCLFLLVVVVITLTGCTYHQTSLTKDITEQLQPAKLYESYGEQPADLKALSKCPLPPTINIVNIETREDYVVSDMPQPNPGISLQPNISPKELTKTTVEYLKYGFEKSQIKFDSNSSKVIHISFIDAKGALIRFGANIKMKVYIPETKYSNIFYAHGYSPMAFDTSMAYSIHVITRNIIDDPVIQDYILCKAEHSDKPLSQKLQELQTALDNGLISKEEYQLKRKVLLETY